MIGFVSYGVLLLMLFGLAQIVRLRDDRDRLQAAAMLAAKVH